MGNLGAMEVLVIFLVALIVLGPTKLPEAARQVGKAVNEVRRLSGGFQKEMREALQEPLMEDQASEKGRSIAAEQRAARAAGRNPYAKNADESTPDETTSDNADSDKTDPDELGAAEQALESDGQDPADTPPGESS